MLTLARWRILMFLNNTSCQFTSGYRYGLTPDAVRSMSVALYLGVAEEFLANEALLYISM